MTRLTSRSTVTADRLYCWSPAGDDPARPERFTADWNGPRLIHDPACLDAGLALDQPPQLDACHAARSIGILLHRPRQPIPHRAR